MRQEVNSRSILPEISPLFKAGRAALQPGFSFGHYAVNASLYRCWTLMADFFCIARAIPCYGSALRKGFVCLSNRYYILKTDHKIISLPYGWILGFPIYGIDAEHSLSFYLQGRMSPPVPDQLWRLCSLGMNPVPIVGLAYFLCPLKAKVTVFFVLLTCHRLHIPLCAALHR
ncbi:hypothetical protein SAMN04488502_10473 [Dendrosporobacter quercicolus]|uniref:Uncharacterized protein n=1 Tax=Dendrosporobacter quercicolus TaxID=146817 RepID=A0A1G9SQR1_9FIRM|nr:hypothetical protein SAMN04488502_10473 [Dendrosporobacter quercicolus]